MRVEILGPLQLRDDQGAVRPVAGARMRSLLIRLAMDAGRAVSATALTEAVWPDGGPDDPRHALEALVSRLRGLLRGGGPVQAVAGGYRLDIPPASVDAHEFEGLVREGRHVLRAGDHDRAATVLSAALALWRADPFPGVDGAAFAAEAARLAELRLCALEDRLAAELPRRGDELVAEAQALASANPLRERSHALLIDSLRAGRRTAEALAAYERVRGRLAEDLGVDPGPELRRAQLAALRADVTRPDGNLGAPLTGLVGRKAEQRTIKQRLAGGRLVTLTGPGGVGKTRLAAHVAGQMSAPGGVWLVELAAVARPADVVHAVVAALDLRDTGAWHRDPTSRLVEILLGRDTLLVLDNCEHVVEAVASLAHELLSRSPNLRVLATSREPLGVTGELLVPILPLDVASAVELFTERARAVRPGFVVDAAVAGRIAQACQWLDRLPLAIEMCAARLHTMPLSGLLSRLDDRFGLLRGGSRTALPRHRTMTAVVAWSWDLLSSQERATAQRLAVFRGGFTAEAAQRMGVDPDPLVAKSLLQFDGTRYRMLETIREFALGTAADVTAARRLHTAYFLDLAVRAAPRLRGVEQVAWLNRLNPERENLTAALDHACAVGDGDSATRLAGALGHFWAIHGEHGLAAERLLAAVRTPGTTSSESSGAASAAFLFHGVLAGGSTATRSVRELLQVSDPLAEALLAITDGNVPGALALLAVRPPDAWKRGMVGLVRSFANLGEGDFHAAAGDLRDSADGFREAGDRWGLSTALTYLAVTHASTGNVDDGDRAIAEAVQVAGELGSDGYQRVWSAIISLGAGDLDRAHRELLEVVDEVSGLAAAMAGTTLADLARHSGDHSKAEQWLELTESRADRADLMMQAMLHAGWGQLALDKGALAEARAHLTRAFVLGRDAPDMGLVAVAGVGLAAVSLRQADPEGAAELLSAVRRWGSVSCNLDAARLTRELRMRLDQRTYARATDRGHRHDRDGVLRLLEAQTRRR